MGQFSSVVPPASQPARNLTASRSTRLTSFKFRAFCFSASESRILCNSVMCSRPTRPLTVKTTSAPCTDLSILSIFVFLETSERPLDSAGGEPAASLDGGRMRMPLQGYRHPGERRVGRGLETIKPRSAHLGLPPTQ